MNALEQGQGQGRQTEEAGRQGQGVGGGEAGRVGGRKEWARHSRGPGNRAGRRAGGHGGSKTLKRENAMKNLGLRAAPSPRKH